MRASLQPVQPSRGQGMIMSNLGTSLPSALLAIGGSFSNRGLAASLVHHGEQGDLAVASSMEKLATGLRINRGADDPAGLIASEDLRAALKMLDAETRAMERTDMVANVADGALGEMSELLSNANAAEVATANSGGLSDA